MVKDAVVVVEAIALMAPVFDRGAQGAAGIIPMGAVAELAATQVVAKLDEAPGDAVGFQVPEGELRIPGESMRIAAAREVVEAAPWWWCAGRAPSFRRSRR